MSCCRDFDYGAIARVSSALIDATYQYLCEVNAVLLPESPAADPLEEGWLVNSPLMAYEIGAQWEHYTLIRDAASLDAAFLTQLRQIAASGGIAPFERGLVPARLFPETP